MSEQVYNSLRVSSQIHSAGYRRLSSLRFRARNRRPGKGRRVAVKLATDVGFEHEVCDPDHEVNNHSSRSESKQALPYTDSPADSLLANGVPCGGRC